MAEGVEQLQSTASASPASPPGHRPWWETRLFVAALILIAFIPLLYPTVPPLVDLPGHMGRYRVMLAEGNSPLLKWYEFRWALIGNLGVDLLVYPLAKLIGLEPAVKLIVMIIPPLTVAGFLWVAREVHGRLPATAAFALPFAFGHPFNYGFVNFALSMAFCFLAFGLWLRLERRGRYGLRALLLAPISCLVWVTHAFGWGALGLLAFSAEAVHQHDRDRNWPRALGRAIVQVLPLTIPILPMLLWRGAIDQGMTGGWFDWAGKATWFMAVLRDRWQLFDALSAAICLAVIAICFRKPEFRFSRNLIASLLVLVGIFLLLPYVIFGSAFADMRLMPFIFAVALLAIRPGGEGHLPLMRITAIAAVGFYLVRIAANTLSYAIAANGHAAALQALDHIPHGSRVVSLVSLDCRNVWALNVDTHLGAMVMVRRHGFSNDQWQVAGANLMRVRYPAAGLFESDPSQMINNGCLDAGWPSLEPAARRIPAGAFDYAWLVDRRGPAPLPVEGAELVWRGPNSALYRLPGAAGRQ